jgi:hypothetical protein
MKMSKRLENKYAYRLQEDYIEFGIDYKGQLVSLDPQRMEPELKKLMNQTNMLFLDSGFIKLSYEFVYDLYYDEQIIEKYDENNNEVIMKYQEPINDYKIFKLPPLFEGYVRVEKIGNFSVTEQVRFSIEFWLNGSRLYIDNIIGNVITAGEQRYVLSEETYKLINKLMKYNREKELNCDIYKQYSTLKLVKEALGNTSLFISKALENIEEPILVDEIEMSAKKVDDEIYIIPQVFDNEQEQQLFSYAYNKNLASNIFRLGNKKVIFKNKEAIKKSHIHRKMKHSEFKEILEGTHELNYYKDINFDGIYSPRVKGVGFIELKQAIRTNSHPKKWFDGDLDNYPLEIRANDGEVYLLSMNDVTELKNLANTEEEVLSFSRKLGDEEKVILTNKEELNQLIKLIEKSQIEVEDIKSLKILDELEDLIDLNNDEYYVINGLSIANDGTTGERIKAQKEKLAKSKTVEMKDNKGLLGLQILDNDDESNYNESVIIEGIKEEIIIPDMIKNHIQLYDHQIQGISKMVELYRGNSRNGVLLADDMGLGKTLQIIVLMAWIKENTGKTNFLIVAPKILINNWIDEIGKFVKDKGLTIAEPIIGRIGSDQIETEIKLEALMSYDIVLTTYTTLKINQIPLGQQHWTMMICDEVQKAKNPKSQIGYAIKTQNADFKIACTATPIENTTEDLWNIMDFSRPGLLGSLKEFRDNFVNRVNDLEEDSGGIDGTRLSIEEDIKSVLGPFVIRRQKKDILADKLPKKKIIIDHLIPTEIEHNYLKEVYELRSLGEPAIAMVGHLIRICAHPFLYYRQPEASLKKVIRSSSKMTWLIRVLDEIEKRDEKVLIFADYYLLQDYIIDVVVDKYGFVPNVINGKISEAKRTKILKDFKNKDNFSCLILSTEVAGVGLTITEANNVIHYMRKWNPAKENQATDRVYRIGQDKDVNVYLPIISYDCDSREEFENMDQYIEAYCNYDSVGKSPDEKLNALLVAKNQLLSKFFFAVNENDMVVNFDDF